ncbi:MAG: DoxX family protein [Bdellovibrionales bacterium]
MNKKVVWAGRIISAVICIPFIFSAAAKLFPAVMYPEMPEQMAKIGLPVSILPLLATLELMCVVVYLIPATSVLGAVLFTGYLGGTIITHLRVDQPAYMQVLFGMIIWLGIYLREPRLHTLLPLRKK